MTDIGDDRDRFNSSLIVLMSCGPGNLDRPNGQPVSVVTVARRDEMENLSLSMKDSRELVTRLLASLGAFDDEFARHVLDEHFEKDEEGRFRWPRTV